MRRGSFSSSRSSSSASSSWIGAEQPWRVELGGRRTDVDERRLDLAERCLDRTDRLDVDRAVRRPAGSTGSMSPSAAAASADAVAAMADRSAPADTFCATPGMSRLGAASGPPSRWSALSNDSRRLLRTAPPAPS